MDGLFDAGNDGFGAVGNAGFCAQLLDLIRKNVGFGVKIYGFVIKF